MLEKIGEKVLKHDKFLNLGLSLTLLGGASYFIEKSFQPQYHDGLLGLPLFLVSGAVGVLSIGVLSTTFAQTNLMTNIGIKLIKHHFNGLTERLLPNKALTLEEKEANKIAQCFMKNLLQYSTLMNNGKSYYTTSFVLEAEDYKKYHTQFTFLLNQFKGTNIVAKCFCLAMYGDKTGLSQFESLFTLQNNTFTQGDIDYIEKFLYKEITLENTLFINRSLGKMVFSQLSLKTQEKLLTDLNLEDIKNTYHNELFKIYKEKLLVGEQKEETLANSLAHVNTDKITQELKKQDIAITSPLDNQEFNTFSKQFNHLFPKSKEILNAIEAIYDAKNKMSTIIGNFKTQVNQHYVEAQLFLDNDVQKVIESFEKEAFLLSQMQTNSHPKLDEKKEMILDSMVERLHLIQNKMEEINNMINDAVETELDNTMLVNKKVLQAKM
jgi:hypothetical protein